MKTYRLSFCTVPAHGLTHDDVMAQAVQAVDAVTIVEHAEHGHPAPGVWSFLVDFVGQGDNEARETMRRALAALSVGYDSERLFQGRERVA